MRRAMASLAPAWAPRSVSRAPRVPQRAWSASASAPSPPPPQQQQQQQRQRDEAMQALGRGEESIDATENRRWNADLSNRVGYRVAKRLRPSRGQGRDISATIPPDLHRKTLRFGMMRDWKYRSKLGGARHEKQTQKRQRLGREGRRKAQQRVLDVTFRALLFRRSKAMW